MAIEISKGFRLMKVSFRVTDVRDFDYKNRICVVHFTQTLQFHIYKYPLPNRINTVDVNTKVIIKFGNFQSYYDLFRNNYGATVEMECEIETDTADRITLKCLSLKYV